MRNTFYIKNLRLAPSLMLVLMLSAISVSAIAQPLRAIIDTSKGEIVVQLNERAAPTTVANFANLAMRGFYDGLTFHRMERNFMVQGGDPLGNGTGDAGYKFSGEIVLHHTSRALSQWPIRGQELTVVNFSLHTWRHLI